MMMNVATVFPVTLLPVTVFYWTVPHLRVMRDGPGIVNLCWAVVTGVWMSGQRIVHILGLCE
jgi:hypothetical protein